MSVSASAVVFFGYVWDESTEDMDIGEDDPRHPESEWLAIIARRRGHVNPWDSFVPSTARDYEQQQRDDDAWVATHRQEIDAWQVAKNAIAAEFGVDLGSHGHHDYSYQHLAISSTYHRVDYGEAFDLATLPKIDPAWAEQLDRWLAEFGIDNLQGAPRWYVVAAYG